MAEGISGESVLLPFEHGLYILDVARSLEKYGDAPFLSDAWSSLWLKSDYVALRSLESLVNKSLGLLLSPSLIPGHSNGQLPECFTRKGCFWSLRSKLDLSLSLGAINVEVTRIIWEFVSLLDAFDQQQRAIIEDMVFSETVEIIITEISKFNLTDLYYVGSPSRPTARMRLFTSLFAFSLFIRRC